MIIKVHRGTHQIGGSIVEIKTNKARIIIDIGEELPSHNKSEIPFDIEGVTKGKPNCDGILVTHYHGDHVGMFERVLPQIPIYMGATAKKILSVVQTAIKKIPNGNKGNPELVATFKGFEAGKSFQIKDIKITPYCIDHSAFDAYMFLIEAEGKRILHTGDFRMHGARGSGMEKVFRTFAKNIDLLIIEGTMLSRMSEKPMTEHELGNEAYKLIKENKNVFVLCSSTNIDTIASFYHATNKNKKPFVVCEDDFQNEILRIVTENRKSSFYDFTKPKVYNYGKQLHKLMTDKGFCFIGRMNYATQIAMETFKDNLLVYSLWKGYLDPNHPAKSDYYIEWLAKNKANTIKMIDLHTSGHATADQIKLVCEITNAKTILPIHSESPKTFLELGIDKDKIRILQDREEVNI